MKRSPSKLDRLKALLDDEHPLPPPSKAQLDALHFDPPHSVMASRVVTATIGAAYVGFHTWKNPLYLLEGFVTAHRARLPMPDWILDAIRPAFEKVLNARGAVTLDAALGFSGKNGKRKPWTARTQRVQDARLKWLFDQQLKKGLPLTSDKVGEPNAVDAVAAILGLDADKHRDSLRQTYQKRLKHHSSRLSR
jgi:hypothetical protein